MPSCSKATSVPNIGLPAMKALVPSIGSMTHWCEAPGRLAPCSSPMMPWSGNWRSISARTAVSVSRSAMVTGLESALSSTPIGVRKYLRTTGPLASGISSSS